MYQKAAVLTPLIQDEHMSEVQATYYSFLSDQHKIPINLNQKKDDKIKPKHDEEEEEEPIGIESGGEHFMPHLMKYVLDNKIGVLPYEVQKDIRHYDFKSKVEEVDEHRIMVAQLSKKSKVSNQMKATLDELDREYEQSKDLNRMESQTTINVEAMEMSSEESEKLDDPTLYFGEKAVDKFWEFYKSDRKFKDYQEGKEDLMDPRQAYFQTCNQLKINPQSRMLIRDENAPIVEFINVPLLDKQSIAVGESIQRFKVPIEQITLKNNGLRAQEFSVMLNCFSNHYEKLQVLRVVKNRIGFNGAKQLSETFKQMKSLQVLDLSFCEIGDLGMIEIGTGLGSATFNLEELDLSGNEIGRNQNNFAKLVPVMQQFLAHFGRLQKLKLGFNNLRGSQHHHVDKLIQSFLEIGSLKELDLQGNTLGQNYGLPGNKKSPPICNLSDVLIKSHSLEILNIANNSMDDKSALSIAHGLNHTQTLKSINIEGNPIGKGGMRLMIQSMSTNTHTKFTLNMANISADKEVTIHKNREDSSLNFDPTNPEGPFNLDLEEAYNQILLQQLLAAAEKAVERNPGAFELKNCFASVSFNGKTKWDPPSTKNAIGLYELGEEPSGILKFMFTLNPPMLKEQEKQIKKAMEANDEKLVARLKEEAAKPIETVDEDSMTKGLVSDSGASNFFEILLEQYIQQDEGSMQQLIINLAREHSLWFSQAHESLYVCKYPTQFAKVAPFLMMSIKDRHIRYALAAQAQHEGDNAMNAQLSTLKEAMGVNSYYFSCFNPNGRYKLNLNKTIDREIAKTLFLIFKKNHQLVKDKTIADRSQRGNQSCFRSEKINGFKVEMTPMWKCPNNGTFEFDFITFAFRPTEAEKSSDQDIQALYEWFATTYKQLAQNINPKQKDKQTEKIGEILGECFRGVSEYFVFNSENLGLFIDLIDSATWKFEVYMAGVGRMYDYHNYDFAKHRMQNQKAIIKTYEAFGILNLFSPQRPNGAYLLKMDVYEERLVCKILLELSKGEGWGNMTEVKVNGKAMADGVNGDFLSALPDTGVFEGTYNCPAEKVKADLRNKMGTKYLDWE